MLIAQAVSSPLCEVLGHDADIAVGDTEFMLHSVSAPELDVRGKVLSCQLEDHVGDGSPLGAVFEPAQAACRCSSLSRLVRLDVQASALMMSG